MSKKETDQIAEALGLRKTRYRERVKLAYLDIGDKLQGQNFSPGLVGEVEGLPVRVGMRMIGGGSPGSSVKGQTRLMVALPGWPTTSELSLQPRGRRYGPMFGSRVEFDDADWEIAFDVKAKDPDMVRLHLDQKLRALIKSYIDEVPPGQNPYSIFRGRLFSGFDREGTAPGVIVDAVRKMVELAKAIVR